MKAKQRIGLLLAVLAMAGLLAGCGTPLYSERASADWGRGALLGQTGLNASVAMLADSAGESTYLAWVGAPGDDGATALHLAQVNGAGQPLISQDLPIAVRTPAAVELAPASLGEMHLLWIDEEDGVRRLFYTRLDAAGNALYAPTAVSPLGIAVAAYVPLAGADGQVHLFWVCEEGDLAGLYYTRLGPDGARLTDGATIRPGGQSPTVCADNDGQIHLAWLQRPDYGERVVYYARFDAEAAELVAPVELARYAAPLGVVAHAPEIGLARDDVYLFWSVERRGGGVSTPMAETYAAIFPQGRPELVVRPAKVVIPADNHPLLSSMETGLSLKELAPVAGDARAATFVYLPSAAHEQLDALPVAYAVQLDGRTKSIMQIVVAVWRDGQIQGYQVAGKTADYSGQPRLIPDGRGNLCLTWLDTAGFGRYDVYYAGTAPETRATTNRVTARDVGESVLGVLWGVAQAMGMLPIAFIWLFLPLVLVLIYVFVRAEGDLAGRGPRVMLIIAVVLYTACKYLFQPNWLAALSLPQSFSAGVTEALMYAVPVLISLLAAGITVLYIRRRTYASLLPSFLIFVAADALLTLLLYVPGILAE